MTARAEAAAIELRAVNALIAVLAFRDIERIADIRAAENPVGIKATLVVRGTDAKIAVLILGRIIGVIRIFTLRILDGELRYLEVKLGKLLEERP